MKKITILVPAYNEEESLPYLYDRVKKIMDEMTNYEFELLFINDGSKDNTRQMLKEICRVDGNVKLIDFSRNFGHQSAITAGMNYSIGQAVVVIDADLQDPPEVILRMLEKWREGYQVVYGKRLKREGESIFKKATAKVFYRILARL